jgi:hypothetical protein
MFHIRARFYLMLELTEPEPEPDQFLFSRSREKELRNIADILLRGIQFTQVQRYWGWSLQMVFSPKLFNYIQYMSQNIFCVAPRCAHFPMEMTTIWIRNYVWMRWIHVSWTNVNWTPRSRTEYNRFPRQFYFLKVYSAHYLQYLRKQGNSFATFLTDQRTFEV